LRKKKKNSSLKKKRKQVNPNFGMNKPVSLDAKTESLKSSQEIGPKASDEQVVTSQTVYCNKLSRALKKGKTKLESCFNCRGLILPSSIECLIKQRPTRLFSITKHTNHPRKLGRGNRLLWVTIDQRKTHT
jgi:hypothetical protein